MIGTSCGTNFVSSSASDLPTTEREIEHVPHTGVPCDNDRFKCSDCLDFDICQPCYTRGSHQEHSFTRLSKPGGPPVSMPARVGATTRVVHGIAVVPTAVNDHPPVSTTPPPTVRRTVQTEASCFPAEATVSPTRVTSHPVHQDVQPSPPSPLITEVELLARLDSLQKETMKCERLLRELQIINGGQSQPHDLSIL
jgi:hypothetical protein